MTDDEMTKLCAEAMGWKHLGAVGILPEPGESKNDYANRGDKLGKYWCYSEQNDWWLNPEGRNVCGPCQMNFDPLTDDVQAMALVRELTLKINPPVPNGARDWWVTNEPETYGATSTNLNRAIVECVAKMQGATR